MQIPIGQSYLSIFTISELKYGIELLETSQKKQKLEKIFQHTLETYTEHIISPDLHTANVYASMAAKQKQLGTKKAIFDLWIAATAKANKLTLVSRNSKDFIGLDVQIINPFLSH